MSPIRDLRGTRQVAETQFVEVNGFLTTVIWWGSGAVARMRQRCLAGRPQRAHSNNGGSPRCRPGDVQGAARSGGLRQALRMVFACSEGVLVSRTKSINELKSLIVVASGELRAQLRGGSLAVQTARIEQLQIVPSAPAVQRLSVFCLQYITARSTPIPVLRSSSLNTGSAQSAPADACRHWPDPAGPCAPSRSGAGR